MGNGITVVVPSKSKPVWDKQLLETPHAAHDKARRVRQMFNQIAPTYELVNRVFSAGRDAHWRRKAVELAAVDEGDLVLDVACGTGDFSRAFQAARARSVIGCDFSHEMLRRARSESVGAIQWCEADALNLPFGDQTFSMVSCAFGIRNFQNLDAGLGELWRVLQAGGRAVILEFTRPANRFVRGVYEFYSSRIMPIGATCLSKDHTGAYRYLPKSVVSFPDAAEVCDRLRRAGFVRCRATPLTLGVVTVYRASRSG